MLDKLFCDLGYLRLVGAQNQTYTRIMFQMIGNLRDIPFLDFNLFKKLPKEKKCLTSKEFTENDVKCGMLGNYGSDLSYLLIILAISAGITVLGKIFLKRMKKEIKIRKDIRSMKAGIYSLFLKFGRFLLKTLQIRFFFLKMDAVVLDALFFSFMNIFTFSKTVPSEAGLASSLLSISFYFGYCCTLWVFAKYVYKATVTANQESENQKTGKRPKVPVFLQLKRFKSPFDFVRPAFEGLYYCPENPSNLGFPLISIVRYASIALVLSGFNRRVWFIPFGCVTIELAFYFYATRFPVKESRMENLVEQFNSFVHVIYNILGIISFTEFSQRAILALDVAMLSVVATKVLVNGILLLIAILFTLISVTKKVIKELRNRLQKKPANSIYPIAKPKIISDSATGAFTNSTKLQTNASKHMGFPLKLLKNKPHAGSTSSIRPLPAKRHPADGKHFRDPILSQKKVLLSKAPIL